LLRTIPISRFIGPPPGPVWTTSFATPLSVTAGTTLIFSIGSVGAVPYLSPGFTGDFEQLDYLGHNTGPAGSFPSTVDDAAYANVAFQITPVFGP
jgi:hypothetical protein